MDSGQFHDAVTKIFKDAIIGWDYSSNPLEWEAVPQALLDLLVKANKEAMEETRSLCFGAPFMIDWGEWRGLTGGFVHNPDTKLKVQLSPLSDADDWSGAEFNLADAVLKSAAEGDKGFEVAHAIAQLRGTIAKLERVSAERGWSLDHPELAAIGIEARSGETA